MDFTNVDLHLHSTASDGTDSPVEIVEKIREKGIKTFALTDHDTVRGVEEILSKADLTGLRFIKGVEFSCRSSKLCHILGYGYDIKSSCIRQMCRRQMESHREKMVARIAFLKDNFNIIFTDEELDGLNRMNRRGKPHLARLMVQKGIADNKTNAFENYLDKIKTNVTDPSPAPAIKAIQKAGGVAIWAHPLGGEGEKRLSPERFQKELSDLLEMGIQGLECYYSRYTEKEVRFLLDTAKKYDLLVSGGSDYHGKIKTVKLGQLNRDNLRIFDTQLTVLKRL